ncbi:MAG: cohesin domain-containing protein, partial [Candidatus Eisenbacteria bacterium]
AGAATAATLTCGTASAIAGQDVTVSLTSSDLTGLGVLSYQFDVGYAPTVVTATGVQTSGTMTAAAGWATPQFSVISGRIRVSAAGTTPLTGSGVLLKLTFHLDPTWINGNSTGLALANALYNEGTPSVTTSGGSITINPTPQIFVSPNSGEIAVGQTIQFSVSGSVTAPVTWSTTNTSVATINASGLLTGVAPGAVRVNAHDNAGLADQDDGDILIRVGTVTVGTGTAPVNSSVAIPITTTSLTGYGIRSGQFQVSYNNQYLTLASVITGPTSMLNGYGTFTYGVQTNGAASTATIAFAGTTDLAGADTLFVLNFNTSAVNYGFIGLALVSSLFNENLPTLRVSGSVNIPSPSTFSISPGSVTLLAGQTQAFTTSGVVVPPLTWSMVPDTIVARINSSTGVLTAKTGGTTQVKAVDSVGGTAFSGVITVYDLSFSVGSITAAPGVVAHVPVIVDRDLTPLNVRSTEYTFGWSPTYVTLVTPTVNGQFSAWGAPVTKAGTNSIRIVNAGAAKLGSFSVIEYIDVTTSAATPSGTDIPLTLTGVILNEGRPIPLVANGTLHIRTGSTGVGDGSGAMFALGPGVPNPAGDRTRLAFTLPVADADGARTRLEVFGADGRRVRRLVDDALQAGAHEVTWDLRSEDGARVTAGVYFARLEWAGRRIDRKLTVIR